MVMMKKGFKISKLISFSISDYTRQRQSLLRTHHHVDSPLIYRFFSSSSYNNRSNDGGRPPPPRRRSNNPSDRMPSSSRLSGYDDRAAGDNNDRGHRGGRRDFDTNRNPNFRSDDRYRSNNRASSEVNNSDHRKPQINTSFVPFDDDEQKPPISSRPKVKDDKIQEFDGFLDRFKLGFDQEETKLNSDKLDSDKATGEAEAAAEELPPPPPEDADEIFKKMKETGLIPNAVAMLHGLCSDGLVQEAMKLFGLMRERGSIPEVIVYTAVVEGFCKSQKPDEAMRIFRKMQNNGITPNAFSYGVLVQGLYKGKRLDDALEFCLEMVEAGHSPNLVTFTGLVNAFCRERGLEGAQIMISSLKDKGFGFDEKGVRDFMEKKGPFLPLVWEAIFGKKGSQMF